VTYFRVLCRRSPEFGNEDSVRVARCPAGVRPGQQDDAQGENGAPNLEDLGTYSASMFG
jgi:hypothetical protein